MERLGTGRGTPKQKAQVIQELRQKYPLKALLQLAGLPRSTFYYYLHRSQNPAKYQMVKKQIITIFNENKKRYGYRRITQELHNNDICVNHKTVRKLMKQLGLVCQVRAKRKYNSYKGEVGEVAPNLLERHFKTNQPNRKWVTDVTEFKVNDQKLYLSPILDLFNGEVVSYNLSRHPNFKQITDMLEGAFQKLPDKVDNLILHSDQGWQYQMKSYQNLLKAKGITQSMSRKATCLDNAVAENFFGLLKTELFYLEKFDSIDQLEKAIIDYIDYYNNRRIKLKLNGLSPVQYRIQTVGVA
ncbi:IS3 family transposase [Faecalibacterium sp. IP-3-29]|nr:IS3 family transposase [Faecalibacterium sp. IP-3-29]UQK52592.1 IS3 family transposase [Faecalibacterium sp. IP-3-29]